MDSLFLNEHRCKCGKLLLKGIFFDGTLEIKCKKCGTINKIGNIKLADDARHYLLIINDKGIVVNVSDSACRILGYTHNELIGKTFTQVNPSMPEEIGKKFFGPESTLSEDNYFQLDTFHQTKDGKKFPVTVLLKLYRPVGNEKYVLVSAELKNASSNKKASDLNKLEFLNYACDFYFDIDKNGIVEYISPSAEKLLGFPQKTFVGKNYFDYMSAGAREEAKKTFQHFSLNSQPFRVVHGIKKEKRGKAIFNELYFTPNFNDSGKFCGYRVLGWIIKKR